LVGHKHVSSSTHERLLGIINWYSNNLHINFSQRTNLLNPLQNNTRNIFSSDQYNKSIYLSYMMEMVNELKYL
jgi:hypothetical protein